VIKNILENSIKTALWSLKIDEKKVSKINLEHPEEFSHGDYSCNIAMILAKQVAQNPRELAEKIVAEINERKPKEISKVEVAGPGFINFYLSPEFFVNESKEILNKGEKFGKGEIGKGKKVIVEYSSPNIAKPFTIGHLRSTVIGDAIANILDFSGYKVIRDNHLGDWGTQFGKLIVAIKKWSSVTDIQKSKTPIKDLVALYVKFHDEAEKDVTLEDDARSWFTKLEHNNKEAKEIWNICVKLSMKEFEKIYKRLGVKFDTAYGESFFEDKMKEVIDEVKKLGIARESEGAYLVFFDKDKYPPMMLLKKDGSTIYALRDLAADKFRKKKYGKDVTIINEVGMEQSLHFQQVFETEKLLGYSNGADRIHVKHGFYRFPEGKMSTRKGNGIWLDEVLDEAIEKAAAFDKNTAEVVGVGAIKFNDLKRESSGDIIFNWDEVLNLKGDSGPYLQYSYARAKSILRKAKEEKVKSNIKKIDGEVMTLEKILYRFPEVVERAGVEYSPHYIATYLIELASSFNNFYGQGKIVDKTDTKSSYKIALTEAFSIVLKNGLNLLGIQAPEKM
jgi:arginyl-tRNA synthetase